MSSQPCWKDNFSPPSISPKYNNEEWDGDDGTRNSKKRNIAEMSSAELALHGIERPTKRMQVEVSVSPQHKNWY